MFIYIKGLGFYLNEVVEINRHKPRRISQGVDRRGSCTDTPILSEVFLKGAAELKAD